MTVKKLLIVAALVVLSSPAFAESEVTTWGCRYSRFYGYTHCGSTWTKIPDPVRDPEQEKRDAEAHRKESEKWEQFCKPTFRNDEFGVLRATYAKQGCEFGRNE
jgi:hypothetical protein